MPDAPEEFDSNLPPKLLDDLSALHAPARVPEHVDRSVLQDARVYLSAPSRRPRNSRWIIGATGAVAAAIALAVLLVRPDHARRQVASVQQQLAGDVNRDGRVDVLDALILAHRLQGGQSPPAQADVNRDGKVDSHDVEAIALAAVHMPREELR
jgi:hypothetical protein